MSKPQVRTIEYGHNPNDYKSLSEMESSVTNAAIEFQGVKRKHSEFQQPNATTDSYPKMDAAYDPWPGMPPFRPGDYPGMVGGVPDMKESCFELWKKMFPGWTSGSRSLGLYERATFAQYAARCPTAFIYNVCCQGAKISGPDKVNHGDTQQYTLSGVGEGCYTTWNAVKGRCVGGTYTAPSSGTSDTIYVETVFWQPGSDRCAEKKIKLQESGTCASEYIIHTTHQMGFGQTQALSVGNAVVGKTYTWVIAAGGGGLSPSTGTSTTYTAPASNADCASNPTIQLKIGASVCDSLKIAVSNGNDCYSNRAYVYVINIWSSMGLCIVRTNNYACNGDDCGAGQGYCDGAASGCSGCPPCQDTHEPFTCYNIGQTLDVRTAAMKTAGCCPAALL